MLTFTCAACKTRMRRGTDSAKGKLLCPECAYKLAGSRKTADLACKLGDYYADQRQPDKAIAAYTEAIQLNPNLASAYAGRANVYFGKQDHARAIHQYTEAIQRGLADAQVYLNRGRCHFQQNDYCNAEADFTAAIRLTPNAWAYRARGELYLERNENDKAIGDYTQAIHLEPQQAMTHSQRGLAYYRKEDYDKAIADFSRAIELRLREAKTFYLLGQCYSHRRVFDKALHALTEALRLDPCYADAYLARGEAYRVQQKLDKALTDYTEAIRYNPSLPDAYSDRALCHLAGRNFDAALLDLGVAAKLDPQSAEVRRRTQGVLDAKKNSQMAQPPTGPPKSGPPGRIVDAAPGRKLMYFYRRKNTTYGPHSPQELRELAAAGLLLPTDELRQDGSTDWKLASQLKAFFPTPTLPAVHTPAQESNPVAVGQVPSPPNESEPRLDADQIWAARMAGQPGKERKYFYRRKRCAYGPYCPYSSIELRELAVAGTLRPDDEVQKDGGDWRRAGDLKKLFAGVNTRQAPVPPAVPTPMPAAPASPPAPVLPSALPVTQVGAVPPLPAKDFPRAAPYIPPPSQPNTHQIAPPAVSESSSTPKPTQQALSPDDYDVVLMPPNHLAG